MGLQCETEEKQICLLSVRVWAKIVAWIQIIWYALKFGAAQQQWPRAVLMGLYGSKTCQFLATDSQDQDDELVKATAKFTETAIMITALVGVLMGTILLVAITKRHKGCMLAWMAYAGGFIISTLVIDSIQNREDIIPILPRLLFTTLFYGIGIYIVRTHCLEVIERVDDKMHEKKACITDTV